jgi:serine/threonine protein kinase/formylglycine-generating enzyme required for sulfatase activity
VYGEYVVLDKIGAGGMGQVFKAEHRRMKRIVALKLLPPAAMRSPDAVNRFQREAQAAARLIHPNIVTAFDAGESAGIHFLVMQFVDGQDLHVVSRERSPLPIAEALDYILQTARGLAYAHEQGVVHRDIKPANLLLDRHGVIRILDMGLARLDGEQPAAVAAGQPELTQAGQVMGTLDYMAPEQAFDTHHADARSDIYSLGCTFYRLITGKNMYRSDTHVQAIVAHRESPIPPLATLRPDVPAAIEAVYQKMVAKRPEDRFQTMKQVIAALEPLRAASPAMAVAIALPVATSVTIDTFDSSAAPATSTQLANQEKPPVGAPLARITEVVASEKSKHLVAKFVGGAFATIIAPLIVVMISNYLTGMNNPPATSPFPMAANVASSGQTPLAVPTATTMPKATVAPTTPKPTTNSAASVPAANSASSLSASMPAKVRLPDWFDALSLVSPPLDAEVGRRTGKNEWEKQADGWHFLPDGKMGRLKMPVLIDGPYFEIECEFTLLAADSELRLTLPLGTSEMFVNFSIADGISGGQYFHPAFRPVQGQRNMAALSLQKSTTNPNLDQLELIFNGSSFRLTGLREKWGVASTSFDGQSFHVLASKGPLVVRAYRIRALDGGATKPQRTEPPPPPAKAPFDASTARQQRASWARLFKVSPEVSNSAGIRLLLIPPGEFMMGATPHDRELIAAIPGATRAVESQKVEFPQHRVQITRPFYMGTTEVTIGQYKKFAATHHPPPGKQPAAGNKGASAPKWNSPGYDVTDASPVTMVSWEEAIAYCNWLSDQEKLPHAYDEAGQSVPHTDARYRLPTEAEWEYACRAGTTTTWYFGDDPQHSAQFAVTGPDKQHLPVGSKKPNAFGLFDMSGSVWEHCQDWFEPEYYAHSPLRDPTGPSSGLNHVARGGSWSRPINLARSAARHGDGRAMHNNSTGFRVVKNVPSAP